MATERKNNKRKRLNFFTCQLPARSVNEGFARGIISAFCAQLDPTVEELCDMKTAISEAVTNCIVHAYAGESDESKKKILIKAEYFDELVDRNLLTNFRETAKQLNVPPKKFVQFLLDKKYVYRDKRGKLMPYEDKNKGLFEVKEQFNEKTQWAGTQTLVTPKGRETFRLLCLQTA